LKLNLSAMHRFLASSASSSPGRAEQSATAFSSASRAGESAASRRSAERPATSLDQNVAWKIRPSMHQIAVQQYTHVRPLPLPATLDAHISGCHFKAQYSGHGQSKLTYLLKSDYSHELAGKILKLCKETDQEPELFAKYSSVGIYPQIHAAACCVQYDSVGQPVGQWNGWITDYAVPLDQLLKIPSLSHEAAVRYIVGAVRCMLRAAKHQHCVSDNGLYNFGRLGENVVIIDAGSRGQVAMSKAKFNSSSMKKFWSRAKLFLAPDELATYQQAWQNVHTMEDACTAFDSFWHSSSEVESSGSSRAEQPAPQCLVACPYVAAALEEISDESLNWLTHTFLWGNVSNYGLFSDGTVGYYADYHSSAEVKLELLIQLTTRRRKQICRDSSTDILTEEELRIALDEWKDDYRHWMHPQKLRDSCGKSQQQWHQILRGAFRTFLFHLSGSYELTLFFLVAPFSSRNLDLYRNSWNSSTTNAEALDLAKRHARNTQGSQAVLHSLRSAGEPVPSVADHLAYSDALVSANATDERPRMPRTPEKPPKASRVTPAALQWTRAGSSRRW
jgi:hypothetical protein